MAKAATGAAAFWGEEGRDGTLGPYVRDRGRLTFRPRSLNEELDADGVRAVAICPAFVDNPMTEWSGPAGDEIIRESARS